MPFRLVYHPLVKADDLPSITSRDRQRIRRALEQRLATRPDVFGKPLRFTLKGLWSLRVGAYRVVYTIRESEVWVLKIGHRRDIYRDAERRTGRADEPES